MTERKAFIAPFWLMVISLGLAVAFLFVLAMAGGVPKAYAQDRCAGIGVIASAVRVQGFDVAVETDAEAVDRVMSFLKAHGLPKEAEAEGLLFVKLPDGMRVSFIVGGCVSGMLSVDVTASEEIKRIVNGDPEGRDA